MEIKIEKQVTKVKNVVIGYKCDNCGKEVSQTRFPDEWHQFRSGHNEWGNDSYESIERNQVCSPDCYVEKLIKLVDEMENINDGQVGDMQIKFAKRMVNFIKNNDL